MNASAITAIRTAAVSGRRHPAPGAGGHAKLGDPGRGRAGALAPRRDAAVRDFDRIRPVQPDAGHAQPRSRTSSGPRRSAAPRTLSAARTSSSPRPTRPIRSSAFEWLKEGAHVNAVGGRPPQMTELDPATLAAAALFVDRRESAENEAGDYRRAARGRRDRARPHPRRDRRGADRREARPVGPPTSSRSSVRSASRSRTSPPPSTSFARPRRPAPASRSTFDPGRRDPLRRRRRSRAPRSAPRSSGSTPEAPAEIYLKLENLQPIGSFKIRGATNAIRQATGRRSSRRRHRERGQHGPGRRVGGPRARRALHGHRSRPRAADQGGRDRAPGRPGRQGPADRWWNA